MPWFMAKRDRSSSAGADCSRSKVFTSQPTVPSGGRCFTTFLPLPWAAAFSSARLLAIMCSGAWAIT